MPSIPIHTRRPPPPTRAGQTISPPTSLPSPLPHLLHTPLGLALLEIQGSLHMPTPPSASASDPHATLEIGRLEFPLLPSSSNVDESLSEDASKEGPWMKKVVLYVGRNQKLVGEVKKLVNPVGILRRRGVEGVDGDGDKDMDLGLGLGGGGGGAGGEELEIMDVVRWKLFFGGRPEFV